MNDSPASPLCRFTTRRTIEFADTDMGGIVHFSRFFVFMETAEHELLRHLGAEVHMSWQGHTIGWPRVEATCQYLSPASFGEELEIDLRIARKGAKSMTYATTFSSDGRIIARGRMTSVCCVMDEPDGLRAVTIPDFIADQIIESRESPTAPDLR